MSDQSQQKIKVVPTILIGPFNMKKRKPAYLKSCPPT
jgi:hypothetical protein